MTFEIPVVKFEFIITEAEFFLTTKFFPVRQLASWVGKLQSLRLAIGPIVSIMCKSLYFLISSAFSWSSFIKLDKNSDVEVTWWRDNLKYFSTYPIIIDNTTVKVDASISSDASGSGYFVVILDRHLMLNLLLFLRLIPSGLRPGWNFLPFTRLILILKFAKGLQDLLLVISLIVSRLQTFYLKVQKSSCLMS